MLNIPLYLGVFMAMNNSGINGFFDIFIEIIQKRVHIPSVV